MAPSQTSTLFEHNQALAHFWAHKFSIAGMDADDVAQEALIALWKASESYDASKSAKFSTFASFAIRNRLINLYRRAMPRQRLYLTEELQPWHWVVGSSDSLMENCREKLKKLPSDEKQAVTLYLEGYTYAEIGRRMKTSKQTAKNKVRNFSKQFVD